MIGRYLHAAVRWIVAARTAGGRTIRARRAKSGYGRATLTAVAGGLALATMAGCQTDPGGHIYTVLNESQDTVIIEIMTDTRHSFSIPPASRGHLSESFASPQDDWQVTVLTEACTEIASLSLEDQPPRLTVHITAAGEAVLGDATLFSFEGKSFPLVAFQSGSCG